MAIRPSWRIEATILRKDASETHLADRSQPVCTAIQLALTDLLHDWNIKPHTVLGHSSGDIAAAYVSGYLTARQAILSSYLRDLSVSLSHEKGDMLATGLNRDQAQEVLDELDLKFVLTVACIYSPKSSTLSGNNEAIYKLESVLKEGGIFGRKLKTGSKAYHSHHMRVFGPVYEELLQRAWPDSKTSAGKLVSSKENGHRTLTARMISSVTKKYVTAIDVVTPYHWRTNLESTVEFEAAVNLALKNGPTHFSELGPHSSRAPYQRDIE